MTKTHILKLNNALKSKINQKPLKKKKKISTLQS